MLLTACSIVECSLCTVSAIFELQEVLGAFGSQAETEYNSHYNCLIFEAFSLQILAFHSCFLGDTGSWGVCFILVYHLHRGQPSEVKRHCPHDVCYVIIDCSNNRPIIACKLI